MVSSVHEVVGRLQKKGFTMSRNTKNNKRIEHNKRVRKIFKDLVHYHSSRNDSIIFGSDDQINDYSNNSIMFVRADQINYCSNSENGEPEYVVELSVLTTMIYEYDQETILIDGKQSISNSNYRPYFVSVIIRISNKNFFKNKDFFEKLESRWLPATLHEDMDKTDNEKLENRRTHATFHKEKTYYCFEAFLVCSASPFKIYKRKITIKNGKGTYYFKGIDINVLTANDYDPNNFKNCLSTTKIKQELDNAWSSGGYKYIDIYNVGHGNADYIVGDNKRILYDIGSSLSVKRFPKAHDAFSKLKPNLVIISHWDTDHYIGCVYASDDVFNVNWIAPQLIKGNGEFSINSFRLAAYLNALNKLMLIDRNNSGSFEVSSGTNNRITLRMGNTVNPETTNITKKNRQGLYLELLENNKKISVLAGDVSYNSMDSSIFSKELTHLHVPHHCSEMNLDPLNNSRWGKNAVISSNLSNGKYEDNQNHKTELTRKFQQVLHTSEINNDICSIRLNKNGTATMRT